MNRSEAKFNNVAKKMNNALFKLIDEKLFQEISVSEICRIAGVNRSTFYAHYQNTTDLLQETHNNYMYELFDIFTDKFHNNNKPYDKVEEFVSEKFIVPYLEFIKKHKKIHKIYMNNISIFNTDKFLMQLLEKIWIPTCKDKDITDFTIVNYMSRYYLSGMSAIVTEWVNNNCEDDIMLICEIIILCVRPENN